MVRRIEPKLVRDVMTRNPRTVGRKTSIRDLIDLFKSHDFNAFPVVDEADVLRGIVTKLDVLRVFRHDPRRFRPDMRALWAEHVDDIMRRHVVTLAPRDPARAAVDRMLASRLRSVPVVENRGRREVLVGIVSRSDVLECLIIQDDELD